MKHVSLILLVCTMIGSGCAQDAPQAAALPIIHDNVASASADGLTISVASIGFYESATAVDQRMIPNASLKGLSRCDDQWTFWRQFDVIGEVTITVTNQTAASISVGFASADWSVNGLQTAFKQQTIAYSCYTFDTVYLGSFDILPGSTTQGGLWFGLKGVTLDDVATLDAIALNVPYKIGDQRGELLIQK